MIFLFTQDTDDEARVRYRPWERCFVHGDLQLPALEYLSDEESARDVKRPQFRLQWPGAIKPRCPPGEHLGEDACDDLPFEFAESLFLGRENTAALIRGLEREALGVGQRSARVPLAKVLDLGLPEEVPDALAYHVAVNVERYGKQHLRPLNGMPVKFVERIVEMTFALDHHHWATIATLKQIAQTQWGNPLMTGFDTTVSDRLGLIAVEAVRCFFFMLSEGIDANSVDDTWSPWDVFASYFFWTGRTGGGCVAGNAELQLDDPTPCGHPATDELRDAVLAHRKRRRAASQARLDKDEEDGGVEMTSSEFARRAMTLARADQPEAVEDTYISAQGPRGQIRVNLGPVPDHKVAMVAMLESMEAAAGKRTEPAELRKMAEGSRDYVEFLLRTADEREGKPSKPS